MNKELIEQIATEIVNKQILENWKFYAVFIGLIFLSSVVSIFVASYLKERGKNLATKADIKKLLSKLEDTETLKAQISDDFVYKSTRRDKIESLFQLIYEFESWHPEQTQKIIAGQPSSNASALISKIEMFVSIYFPKCIDEALLLKKSDLLIVTFNLEIEAKIKEFDGQKNIDCMQPVKANCENLRNLLIEKYQDELRL